MSISGFGPASSPPYCTLLLGPVASVVIGEAYVKRHGILGSWPYYVIPAAAGVLLFFVSLQLRCEDCGETGGILFGARHECEAIRRRREAEEPIGRPRQSRAFLVIVFLFMGFLLLMALIGNWATL